MEDIIYLHFDTDLATANQLAEELQTFLSDEEGIDIKRIKLTDNTMDFGASLVLILGTPAVLAIAKGIQVWLQKKHDVSITFEDGNRKIIAKNLTCKDIPVVFEGIKNLANNAAKKE